jgi:hypothetical protein
MTPKQAMQPTGWPGAIRFDFMKRRLVSPIQGPETLSTFHPPAQ